MTSRTVVLVAWAVVAGSAVACGVLGAITRGRFATVLEVTRRLTSGRAAPVVVFLGWLWLGWHLFAR